MNLLLLVKMGLIGPRFYLTYLLHLFTNNYNKCRSVGQLISILLYYKKGLFTVSQEESK